MAFTNSGSLGRGKTFSVIPSAEKSAYALMQRQTLARPLVFVAGMRHSAEALETSPKRADHVGQSLSGQRE